MIYVNNTTGERYYGSAMTKKLDDSTLWSGVPTAEQLEEWGFEEYIPPTPPELQPTDEIPDYEALQIITEGE